MRLSSFVFAALLGAAPSVVLAGEAQPKAAAPAPEKPAALDLRKDADNVSYKLVVKPGVSLPDRTLTVTVELAEILKTPDPTFGSRRPVDGASVELIMVAPTAAKKKAPPPWADARRAIKLGDVGTYGATFTPPVEGVYGLYVRSTDEKLGELTHGFQVPVGVWPIPEGTETPQLPAKLPEATSGNIKAGRVLCDDHCSRTLDWATPERTTPTFLMSGAAAALDDAGLLQKVTGDKAKRLSPVERADLLFYLRGLHVQLREFFPAAQLFMAKSFTINEHGLKRLKDSASLSLDTQQATGTVFVVYTGDDDTGSPRLVNYDDRVARDRLKRENKIGYLVFFETPDAKMKEVGIALGKEPKYPILTVHVRSADGKRDAGVAKELKSFSGQGSFNDPKSLSKGSPELRKKLLPLYLRAAELATMYYLDEREFTAFDEELN